MKYFVLNGDKTAWIFVFLLYNSVLYNKVHYFTLLTIKAVPQYFRLLWFCHVIGGNTAFLRNLQFSAYYHSSGADAINGYSSSECYFLKKSARYQFYILSRCYFLGSDTSFATLMNVPHLPHTLRFPSFCCQRAKLWTTLPVSCCIYCTYIFKTK